MLLYKFYNSNTTLCFCPLSDSHLLANTPIAQMLGIESNCRDVANSNEGCIDVSFAFHDWLILLIRQLHISNRVREKGSIFETFLGEATPPFVEVVVGVVVVVVVVVAEAASIVDEVPKAA